MNKTIQEIYQLILELSWHFGNHGFDGKCCEGLSFVEFIALKKIQEKKDITILEIGNALNFTKSGASKIIDRLENKGYVAREISAKDGRVCCVNVTPKGVEITADIVKRYSSYIFEMLKELDSDTIEHIKRDLEILVDSAHTQGNL